MADASGMISSLAFDQAPNQNQSALDVFLQIFPRSAAEFQTAAGPDFADVPFPPPISRRPADAISCATRGGTWDARSQRCIPPVETFPPPIFPGGAPLPAPTVPPITGGAPTTTDQQAPQDFCDRIPSFLRFLFAPCLGKEAGRAITGDAAGAAAGAGVASIAVIVVGIILILVALALIVK